VERKRQRAEPADPTAEREPQGAQRSGDDYDRKDPREAVKTHVLGHHQRRLTRILVKKIANDLLAIFPLVDEARDDAALFGRVATGTLGERLPTTAAHADDGLAQIAL
jgi:hypothetical protein